ncbi:MAG TPA: chlorite dismutase family protein [Anaerolineae bacterium]|jgi:chlorite dismutase
MPEETPRTLNHFGYYAWKDSYWALAPDARAALHQALLQALRASVPMVDVYQVAPAESGCDLLIWTAAPIAAPVDTSSFFDKLARALNPYRAYLLPVDVLWGFTRPSQYTKTRSNQEIDPFSTTRKRYLVVYPFVKTTDWYLMGREARQGFMNEHIRIGKQYEDVTQLLLYSFGLQNQEFVVVYEMDDPTRFSDLVNELRSAEGRRYTERDTPLHMAIYHRADETLGLFK